jgi:hypothetical protein
MIFLKPLKVFLTQTRAMVTKTEKPLALFPFLKKLLFLEKKQPPVKTIYSKRRTAFSPEKKAELEKLCEQLFKQKKHITSGKFQFIGLTKIKKHMGKRWSGLCKIVYDVAEAAIDANIDNDDLSIRYKDDTYVIIFARASLEEGKLKAALIAEEIQRRLFRLEEDDLKDIEVRKAIREIRTDFLISEGFPDFLDALAIDWEDVPLEELPQDIPQEEIKAVEVDTAECRMKTVQEDQAALLPENIAFTYLPLWDVPRNALTTYFCIPCPVKSGDDLLESHQEFYRKLSALQQISLDIQTLQHVMGELAAMEKDGRKLLIACPVHYDTVYRFDNYEKYKEVLEKIPEMQKQFLVFVIMNMSESVPSKDPYWFAAPLRAFCRHVFAEVPLRRDINFNYLRNSGVDVVGVRLNHTAGSEQEIIHILNSFSSKAKSLKIPMTFVLGISSLSLTTSVVCAGFDFLGGSAIHDGVGKPDIVHRYRHEDLLSALVKKT